MEMKRMQWKRRRKGLGSEEVLPDRQTNADKFRALGGLFSGWSEPRCTVDADGFTVAASTPPASYHCALLPLLYVPATLDPPSYPQLLPPHS